MVVGIVTLKLYLPACRSLKEKRGIVKGLTSRLRRELNISVAEVDHQDVWQHTMLGVAIAAGSEVGARKIAQQVEKIVWREPRVELVAVAVDLTAPDR